MRYAPLALLMAFWGPVGVMGQAGTRGATGADPMTARDEALLLREASSHEWRGEIEQAERVLVDLLEHNPTSSGGLFALERILRTRSRVAGVLPFVDRFLEQAPAASGPRYMKLRVLVEIDSLAALPAAAAAWFDAEPGSPDPYREVGRIYQRAYGDPQALEVLRAGRDAVAEPNALALEIGDALARIGDAPGAVAEWARALDDPRADLDGVVLRLERLEGDRATLAAPLLAALTRPGSSEERRRAAVRVAIELGRGDLARRVAEDAFRGLPPAAAPGFLQEVARRAESADMADLSLWALSTLRRTAPAATGDAASEARMASAALAVGDTVAAIAAQTRMARALPPGSLERRRAVADLIRVETVASQAEPADLLGRLTGFRAEFPDAPELDELTARVAAGLAWRGDSAGALALVDPGPGPNSALERAWLLLDAGDVVLGREALAGALTGLAPSAATEVIQLIALLDRVAPVAADALARSAARAHHGHGDEARALLEAGIEQVSDDDRSALLFQAAQLALAQGDSAAAGAHFARIEGAHPDSPETAESMLRYARMLAADPARADQARSLLERLILERPQAAVVPDARRALERLGRGS